jgi:FkbM family methyltransferase
MYYLRENSLTTPDPVFFRLRKDCLVFPDDEIVAKDFALQGNYEQSIIHWATTLIDPKTIFLDIGAHVGTYTLAFAKVCAGVHSFECSPKTFNYLCANLALQDLNYTVTPHRTALGDITGTTRYYLRSPKDGGGNSCMEFNDKVCDSVEVPLTTLDSFKLTNIGLIKMDVEGFESKVLEGARETLKANGYPRILFESWRPSRDSQGLPASALRTELFETLASVGYNQITPISGWDEMFIAESTKTTKDVSAV